MAAKRAALVALSSPVRSELPDPLSLEREDGRRVLELIQMADPYFLEAQFVAEYLRLELWAYPWLPAGHGRRAALERAARKIRERLELCNIAEAALLGPAVWSAVTLRQTPALLECRLSFGVLCWYLPSPLDEVSRLNPERERAAGRILREMVLPK